jgi:hypothetical protein
MPNGLTYKVVVRRARVHLQSAWAAFCDDPAMQWREIKGYAPRERERAWVDALKHELAHHEAIERRLSRHGRLG